MAQADSHLEIEHKFVLPDDFDRERFFSEVKRHQPLRCATAQVVERYFVTKLTPGIIYRHRYDENNQDLTYKSFGHGDIEVRREVRLSLDLQSGNQVDRVQAFLAPLGVRWQGGLTKELHVFNFSDCELVYYTASTDDKSVTCVEFEALATEDIPAALATLSMYEKRFGFIDNQRSRRSLFELLFADCLETKTV